MEAVTAAVAVTQDSAVATLEVVPVATPELVVEATSVADTFLAACVRAPAFLTDFLLAQTAGLSYATA
jgi:hypothetical protein